MVTPVISTAGKYLLVISHLNVQQTCYNRKLILLYLNLTLFMAGITADCCLFSEMKGGLAIVLQGTLGFSADKEKKMFLKCC